MTSLGQFKRKGLPTVRNVDLTQAGAGSLFAFYRVCVTWSVQRSRVADAFPAQIWPQPGLSCLQHKEKAEMVLQLFLTLSRPHWMPGPPRQAPKCNAGVFALLQPGALTSGIGRKRHLGHPARDEMAGDGSRKDCAALTCVAASYASWSGLKPIWTFFGHWRKHLRNLKSEQGAE